MLMVHSLIFVAADGLQLGCLSNSSVSSVNRPLNMMYFGSTRVLLPAEGLLKTSTSVDTEEEQHL